MLYTPPTGAATANDPYIGKNVAAGTQGSKVPPHAVEYPQREIVNAITAAGIAPSNSDLNQLTRTIRGGQLDYSIDHGTADALIARVSLAHTGILAGLPFAILKSASPNATATPTLTIADSGGNNGFTATIVKANGSPLAPGDLPASALIAVRAISPIEFALVSLLTNSSVVALISANTQTRIVANTTLYVDPATGSDTTGTGTSGAPFATPGAAYAYAQRYLDLNGFVLTILCANTATYSLGVICVGSIKGALSPDTVVFSFPSGGTFLVSTGTPCFNGQQGANFTVKGAPGNLLLLQANPTSGTASCIACVLGSNVQFAYINFGYAYFSQILVGNNSLLQAIGPCTISNQSQTFIFATSFAYVRLTVDFTITGSPHYQSCFAACSQSNLLFQGAGEMVSFTGSATGSRYSILGFGEIFTNGQATTFLPGDSAGTITNGVYA